MEQLNLFWQYVHTLRAESITYNINLINGAANGAIHIDSERLAAMSGGITQWDFFAYQEDLIKRRNPNGNAALELKELENKMDNSIRLAFTTESLNLSTNIWHWIGRDPAIAAKKFNDMLAVQRIEEYLKRSFMMLKATAGSNPLTFRDATVAATEDGRSVNYRNLALAAAKFGDQSSQIKTWIMPSGAKTDMLLDNLKNVAQLFSFNSVNGYQDAEGRTIITTDDPNLVEIGGASPDEYFNYWCMGLRPMAVRITEIDDQKEAYGTKTGFENIAETYQANWSTKFDVYGYKFDAAQLTGDANKFVSASDAAIASSANWTQVTNNHKQTAGVTLKARGRTNQ